MSRKIKFFIIGLGLLLILVVVGGVISLLLGLTYFDIAIFLNKLFDFSLGLISFLVAFSLGQVYWDKKIKSEKSLLLRQMAISYIAKINSLAIQAKELLQRVSANQVSQIEERQHLVSANIEEINKIAEIYIAIFGQLSTVEDTIFLGFYFENIQPLVSKLLAYKNSPISSDKANILSALILSTQQFNTDSKEEK
jgi:hypothetical protein